MPIIIPIRDVTLTDHETGDTYRSESAYLTVEACASMIHTLMQAQASSGPSEPPPQASPKEEEGERPTRWSLL